MPAVLTLPVHSTTPPLAMGHAQARHVSRSRRRRALPPAPRFFVACRWGGCGRGRRPLSRSKAARYRSGVSIVLVTSVVLLAVPARNDAAVVHVTASVPIPFPREACRDGSAPPSPRPSVGTKDARWVHLLPSVHCTGTAEAALPVPLPRNTTKRAKEHGPCHGDPIRPSLWRRGLAGTAPGASFMNVANARPIRQPCERQGTRKQSAVRFGSCAHLASAPCSARRPASASGQWLRPTCAYHAWTDRCGRWSPPLARISPPCPRGDPHAATPEKEPSQA